ncbi:MAG: helix-turn-helix domain-containing protein [Polyangiales bacterium]
MSHEVAGCNFVATLPATACSVCGHLEVDHSTEDKFILRIAQILAESGVASGRAFRFMRKAIGLRATELAQLLSVAPETVSRWETEKRGIDRATIAVVASLVNDRTDGRRSTLDSLKRLRAPLTLPATMRIDIDTPPTLLAAQCA